MAITTVENVIKLLYSYNPWWRTGIIPGDFIRPVKRFAFKEAVRWLENKSVRRFVLLSGARRVGKTTIMYQMMQSLLEKGEEPKSIIYISFDHPILKFYSIEEIIEIYISNVYSGEKCWMFFDEIQYANDWELYLKVFYDSRPNFHITATGSASPLIEKGAGDSGVGRWNIIKVPTLSFYEYCKIAGIQDLPRLDVDIKPTALVSMNKSTQIEIMHMLEPLQKHFARYLAVGGFPELVLSKDDFSAQRILREDVVDKVLKRDIPSLFNIRNSIILEKVFLYLCFNSSNIINTSTISKELEGTPRATIDNYIEYLERANLIYRSMPVEMSGKLILKASPKIYISDAAIRNAVLMIDINDLVSNPEEMGLVAETAVYKHLAAFYYPSRANIGYYRKTGNVTKEIDIVVDYPTGKILAEVKYRENPVIKHDDAIIEIANSEKEKILAAFVVTKTPDSYGVLEYKTKVPVYKIPAYAFLYLLGHAEENGYKEIKNDGCN
ncbi:MAG: ATP-binding protein [Clostridiales bacterium]|nr:ATP-binding protein [Clostridiales bacterium]